MNEEEEKRNTFFAILSKTFYSGQFWCSLFFLISFLLNFMVICISIIIIIFEKKTKKKNKHSKSFFHLFETSKFLINQNTNIFILCRTNTTVNNNNHNNNNEQKQRTKKRNLTKEKKAFDFFCTYILQKLLINIYFYLMIAYFLSLSLSSFN